MSETDLPLPGNTRIVDAYIDGRVVGRCLHVDVNHPDDCRRLWEMGGFCRLAITSHENPGLASVAILDCLEDVTDLHLLLDAKVDLAPLQRHRECLRRFFCNDRFNAIEDIEAFPLLASLGQVWLPSQRFPDVRVNLQRLGLRGSAAKQSDLSRLPDAPKLTELSLASTTLVSVNDIERYSALTRLYLFDNRKLVDLGPLNALSKLRLLDVGSCKAVDFSRLDWAGFQAIEKIVLEKCGALDSIGFIRALPNLKHFVLLDVDVRYGDMTPILDCPALEHFAFTKRKHFSHGERELRCLLLERSKGIA